MYRVRYQPVGVTGIWFGGRIGVAPPRHYPVDTVDAATSSDGAVPPSGRAASASGEAAPASLSHAIGGLFGGHHGTLNAILLPASLEFNLESCLPKFRSLAQAAGIPVEGVDDQGCADAFIEYIADLNSKLEISLRLSDLGINESYVDQLADYSMKDHCHLTNPRKSTLEDFNKLLRRHM